jgi:hypothetical protein
VTPNGRDELFLASTAGDEPTFAQEYLVHDSSPATVRTCVKAAARSRLARGWIAVAALVLANDDEG